jgi:valyl-tRNA synthetase
VNGVAPGADQQLSQAKLEHARNFGNKLWNISRFVLRTLDDNPDALRGHKVDERPEVTGDAARWILSRTDAAVAEATRLIESYLFGEYLVALEGFIWGEFADFYIELAKPSLRGPDRAEAARTLAYVLDRILRLLHPSMPFITETIALQLWTRAGTVESAPSLVVSRWPEAGKRDLALEDRFAAFVEVVRTIRNLRQQAGLDPSARAAVSLAGQTSPVRDLLDAIGQLTKSDVTLGPPLHQGPLPLGAGDGAPTVVRAMEIRLVAERDAAGELERLERELIEARALVQRSRDLLARPGFVEKARPDVVRSEREKLAEREERVRILEQEIKKRRS